MASRVQKAKTQRGKRFYQSREAKNDEDTKQTMLIRGGKTSELVTQVMKDVLALKKPNATLFQRKNILRPFEDQTSLEFFSQKNDAALMLFGSHSKKRPHNLVFGVFHDSQILDMIEFGVEKYKPICDFKNAKITAATKPCLMFSGEAFETQLEFRRARSMLTDFWRGEKTTNVRLAGIKHVIQFTAHNGKILMRSYKAILKKSGLKTPRVELEEIGPSLDLVIRRTRLATDDLYKQALKQPRLLKPKKTKNIDRDAFGAKMGRIHMQSQDLAKLQTRKMKGLKRGGKVTTEADVSDKAMDVDSSPPKKKKTNTDD